MQIKHIYSKTFPFKPKSRSITDMERAEIKRIGDFLSDVSKEAGMTHTKTRTAILRA